MRCTAREDFGVGRDSLRLRSGQAFDLRSLALPLRQNDNLVHLCFNDCSFRSFLN